jgi:integrase
MSPARNSVDHPKLVTPSQRNEDVQRFSKLVVERSAPNSTYTERQLRVVVQRFVHWCHHDAALPLKAEVVLSNYVIERYVAALDEYGDHSRGTIRSRLRDVARIMGPPDHHTSLVQYPRSSGSAPYNEQDIAHLRSWARTQSTGARRWNAAVLLGLGFGAGLLAAEILATRMSDVHARAGGVVVNVLGGAEPRTVPVLSSWSDLIAPVTTRGGAEFIFRPNRTTVYPNAITNFIAATRPRIQLTARRMRATWLVHHLDAGTPLIPLLHTSGLHTAEALDPFLQFARSWSGDELDMALRR